MIRVEGGCVVATETMGDDGVPWINLTRFDDTIDPSEESLPLPKKP